MHRTDGYTTDVDFPAYFYPEMQPVWMTVVARLLGVAAPPVSGPFRYCELGCGPGINLLVAAACHPQARFVGVDSNERPLQRARAAARAAGLDNLDFVHSDFAAFAVGRSGPFDFMAAHGVWSWVAPQHQEGLLACVQTGLADGGVFYLHYMCHPGSTDLASLQQVLNLFAPQVPGDSARQVQMGLKLLEQLSARGLFVDQPGVLRHLDNLLATDPAHLAHEFLTDHWQPMHSVEVHRRVAQIGPGFLGSADVFNNLDVSLSVPGKLQSAIRQTRIPALAETLKDLARNSHQRMDLFQHEPRPLEAALQARQLATTVYHRLPGGTSAGPITFATPIGPLEGPPALCREVLDRLSTGPATVAELAELPAAAGQLALLWQTLQLLQRQGFVHPGIDASAAAQATGSTAGSALMPAQRAERLTRWFASERIGLQVLADCGTAVRANLGS